MQSYWAIGLLLLIVLLAAWLAVLAHLHRAQGGNEELPGMAGEITQAPDARGRAWALVRGELWQVRARVPLHLGQAVRVRAVRGLVLEVEPMPESAANKGETS
jgi:membrane-bound serine protease (ClpP class)